MVIWDCMLLSVRTSSLCVSLKLGPEVCVLSKYAMHLLDECTLNVPELVIRAARFKLDRKQNCSLWVMHFVF